MTKLESGPESESGSELTINSSTSGDTGIARGDLSRDLQSFVGFFSRQGGGGGVLLASSEVKNSKML